MPHHARQSYAPADRSSDAALIRARSYMVARPAPDNSEECWACTISLAGSKRAPGEPPTYHPLNQLRDQVRSRLLEMGNRRILITGVARGLGLAMTEKF